MRLQPRDQTMHQPLLALVILACTLPTAARAQPNLVFQFSSGGAAVSCAYAPLTNTVWVYGAFGATIREFSPVGGVGEGSHATRRGRMIAVAGKRLLQKVGITVSRSSPDGSPVLGTTVGCNAVDAVGERR